MSIRRRALDLLFAMCDAASAPEVVGELLKHLVVADFGVREELVLKVGAAAGEGWPLAMPRRTRTGRVPAVGRGQRSGV